MTNPALETIATTRRAHELQVLQLDKERAQRALADGVIGCNGQPRSAWQTSQLNQVVDELDARADGLRALTGDDLVNKYCREYLPAS
jgi:hypothetical protein